MSPGVTARQLGVPTSECVFVDDTASNLPAARDPGMATVHFTDTMSGIAEIEKLIGIA
jgi:FMN phosphatase YigB (HAD superfamily)